MTSSVAQEQIQRRAGLWWAFPLHQLLSTVGVLILAGFLTFATLSPSRARWILTGTPYFPVQIVIAFFIGFVFQHYLRHRVMEWVWVLPFLILCVSVALTPLPLVGRFDRYFGWGCRPELHCFVQLAATLPFYTTASYSLAAFLSRTLRRNKQQHGIAK